MGAQSLGESQGRAKKGEKFYDNEHTEHAAKSRPTGARHQQTDGPYEEENIDEGRHQPRQQCGHQLGARRP